MYCPDEPVTRGQAAAFIARALGYSNPGTRDLFTDDDGSIFEAHINMLGTEGVTVGCNPPTNDRYCPNDPLRRDQMASLLTRALGLTIMAVPPAPFTFGPGTYRVGTELPPGIYRNEGDRHNCEWERLYGFSGEELDVIAGNTDDVRQIVEIQPTDTGFFASAECGVWSDDLTATKPPTEPFGSGAWLVDDEVSAGLWANEPAAAGCIWSRLARFSGLVDDEIDGGVVIDMEPVQVQIDATAACGTWTYLGP